MRTLSFKFTTYPQKGFALLSVDADDQQRLKDLRIEEPDDWGTTVFEIETLEPFTCNSEWLFVNPADTGDMTDAPILGRTDEEGEIVERYAYMDYALGSFLDDLADKGASCWQGGIL